MKKVFIFVLISALLAGCSSQSKEVDTKADSITAFYGFSSYALDSTDQKVIDNLLKQFNSLSFEKTDKELDLSSEFHVIFYLNGKKIKSFHVDKNKIFRLDDGGQSYRISSGSFDYEYLKSVYTGSQK